MSLALAIVALATSPALADLVRDQEWWLHTLHVTRAWDSSQGAGVTVALLDTGVDPAQHDLVGSVISGPDYTRSGRVPGGPDWGIHGTAMASLIAGHGHGPQHADGMMGIAPQAKVMSVRVTLERGDPLLADPGIAAGLPTAIARGIKYAVRHGADVIDLPLDPVLTPGVPGSGGSDAERAAVRYALNHHVVLVAPAGDNGAGLDTPDYPAAYRGVISVGAFNATFVKAAFSSRQPYVTLTAAGNDVVAAGRHGRYTPVSSTSAASAVVSGIVALIRAQFPKLRPAQVTKALIESTMYRPPRGHASGSGYGTADAAKALAAAAKMANAVPVGGRSPGGQQSQPPTPPPPPTTHATSSGLGHTLLIDTGIAVAVFIVLLGAIFAVGALQRRRARSARLAPVRAAAQVPPRAATKPAGRAASNGTGHAGRATTLPPVGGPPAPPPSAPFPPVTPRGSEPGIPAFGPPSRPAGGAPAAFPTGAFGDLPARPPGSAGAPAVPGETTSGLARRPLGEPRTGTVRAPQVSGNPPWEPAPRPDSELPWTQGPSAPAAGPAPGPAAPDPAAPETPQPPPARLSAEADTGAWEAVAAEVWPGGPRAAQPHPPAPTPADAGDTAAARRGPAPDEYGAMWSHRPQRAVSPKPTRGMPPWEMDEGASAAELPAEAFSYSPAPSPAEDFPATGLSGRLPSSYGGGEYSYGMGGDFPASGEAPPLYPPVPPEETPGPFGALQASETTETFAAVSPDLNGSLSETTETFDAVPPDDPGES